MIRIAIRGLTAALDAHKPKWRRRAAAYTAELVRNGAYSDGNLAGVAPPNWSDVKPVFMAFQANKCAYCERQLETAHELDVEHFRPKSQVTAWPGPPAPLANGRPDGYWWLAYDITNYCVACKPCNSGLKSDYFPIARAPGAADADVQALNATEAPILIFPLGDQDADPESLIGWAGITPVPRAAAGTAEHLRAEATIAFFNLAGREMLDRQRANEVLVLWLFLEVETNPQRTTAERAHARVTVDRHLASPKKSMRACLNAFAEAARRDRVGVQALVDQLQALVSPP